MTAIAVTKLLTFIESLLLGVIAVSQDPVNRTNRVFSWYIFSIAASALVEFMLVTSINVESYRFWKQFDTFMYFAVAAFFHFSLLLYGVRWASTSKFCVIWYGMFAPIAIIEGFITRPREVVSSQWSLEGVYTPGVLNMHAAFVIWCCCVALVAVAVLFLSMKKAHDRRSRIQAAIFFWSSVILVAAGAAIELIASVVVRSELPFSLSSTTIFLLVNPLFTFAVIRYGVLKLTPLSAVSEIMHMMSECVIIADRNGFISYANKAATAISGLPDTSPPLGTIDELGLMRDSIPVHYNDLRHGGRGLLDYECLLEPPGRSALPVSVSSSVLTSKRWGETGLIITMRDISERTRMEEIRLSAEQLMRHDLRNAITGIHGMSSALRTDPALSDEQREGMTLIYNTSALMSEQIDSYLYLMAIEKGVFNVEPDNIDLAEVVRYVCENQMPLARNLSMELRLLVDGMEYGPSMKVWVRGVRSLYFGMLVNLVKNALEAAPKGSTVTIDLQTPVPVTVTVHNRGVIPLEIRHSFFTKYTSAGKQTGIGLGTYGAKLIADAMGCSIDFTTSEEYGTTLRVEFPGTMSGKPGVKYPV